MDRTESDTGEELLLPASPTLRKTKPPLETGPPLSPGLRLGTVNGKDAHCSGLPAPPLVSAVALVT